ncbi:MAG: hypothetical protein HC789_18810 [Microcoleus sp. CSU_2_2]|nr:hypothetical protein [Microcoleus sp. SU_5_3]NJS12276.1 hypothetical protein [Microcoleus sp. CSU_2_2]
MKRTVLISSTILAIITLLELNQASKALPAPETIQPTVNNEVEVLLKSDVSMRRWRRQCRDDNGGSYTCPRFVLPQESQE